MQINPDKLLTVTNFAKQKGLTRQHIYRLIDAGLINSISIDNILFVVMDEKAKKFKRQRKEKRR
jgi:hypothetical protein